MDKKVIGFVSSTISNPANESYFSFIITKGEDNKESCRLNKGDIVRVDRRGYEGEKEDIVYAIVESISSFSDAPDHVANYISSNFGKSSDPRLSRIAFNCVEAKVLSNADDDYFPVKSGDKVYLCNEENKEEIYSILYAGYDKSENVSSFFPIGLHEMYKGNNCPLKLHALLNKEYLIGPMAAHLNISGMSGAAAKTTKAMEILRELFLRDKKVSVVVFNTKGEDLLDIQECKINEDEIYQFLEKYPENSPQQSRESIVFNDLRPLMPGKSEKDVNNNTYVLDYNIQKKAENLDLLTATDDESGTMDSCAKIFQTEKIDSINSWGDLKKNAYGELTRKESGCKDNKRAYPSIQDATAGKYRRLIDRVIPKAEGIFEDVKDSNADITKRIELLLGGEHKFIVVDIASLKDNPLQQAMVFGCVIRAVKKYCSKENSGKVAVFVDELNKYASSDIPSSSPILQNLIDIAETGRSIGLCLVTAEQSLSVIHKRIKANFANHIYGRTGIVELSQADYQLIPDSFKQRMTQFKHGDGLISTPSLNSGLLNVKFPNKFYDKK